MTVGVCPTATDLERLFLGGLSGQNLEAAEQHVLDCGACLATLKTLFLAKETLAGVLRDAAHRDPFDSSPVLDELIGKLEGLRPAPPKPLQQESPMIAFACPKCQKRLSVNENLAGKKAQCPACGQVMQVPAPVAAGHVGSEAPRQPSSPASGVEGPTPPPLNQPDGTVNLTSPSSADASHCEFLAPPQAVDELGRLGNYRILRILGHGGMGVVYQAEDPKLKRSVALKAMLPALAASANAGKRFLREAQAMAAVEHDHIVRIYQVDEDRGVPFLAMEFLKGESLDERLKRDGKMPLLDVVRIGREIAEALAAAHATGLIHRDVKPANIWLEAPRDRVKILDFGLARAASQEAGLTQQGAIVGTPAFMAPEQARGEVVDARCDLFSLGVVLYRLCTGQQPFRGTDTISTLMEVTLHEPPAPVLVNPELPQELSDLVMQLLAKDPAQRIASAAVVVEVLHILEKTLRRAEEADDRTLAGSAAPPGRAPAHRGLVAGLRTAPPRRRLFAILGGAAAAVALVVTGIVLFWETPNGTVRIEINDPDIQVAFDKKDLIFKGIDKQDLKVSPGAHGLHVKRGNLEFDTVKPIVIKKGDLVTLRIEWLKDGKLQVVQGGKVIGAKELPKVDPAVIPPPRTDAIVQKFLGHTNVIRSVALSRDGKYAVTGSFDKTAILWDAATGKKIHTFLGDGCLHAALSGDGKRVLAGSSDTTLWEAASAKKIQTFQGHTSWVAGVALSGDGERVLTGSPDKTAILWDAASGKILQTFQGPTGEVWDVALSGDAKRVLTGSSDKTAILWDAASGKILQTFNGHAMAVHGVALSGDSKIVLTGSLDGTAILWDAASGKKLQTFQGHTGTVERVALSGDGRRVLTGSSDKTAILWDAATGKKIQTFRGHTDTVFGVALSRDGKLVLTGSADKTAILWAVKAAPSTFPPLDPAWLKRVAAMKAEQQIEAVKAELRKRNPGFDAKIVTHTIDKAGVVTELQFVTDKVTDLSPVRALVGLRRLSVGGSNKWWEEGTGRLTDLSPLMGMKLVDLFCGGTRVSDLSPLKEMKLTNLDFNHTPVTDLSPLKGMPLRRLYTGGKETDLSPLKGMPLTELSFSGAPVSDLSPLKDMKLTVLNCSWTHVSDLSLLKDMRLTVLNCSVTNVSDLSPLKGMPLTQIWCDFKRFRDTEILRSLKTLKKINGKDANLFWKEVDAQQAGFDAWVKQVAAMKAEQQVEAVKAELMRRNPGFDAKSVTHKLDQAGVVTELEFVTDNVTDIAPVRALTGLRTLGISGSGPARHRNGKLADLSPLKGLKLTRFYCRGTHVSDLSPLRRLPLTGIDCDFKAERDAAILRSIGSLETINGQARDAFWKEVDARQAGK